MSHLKKESSGWTTVDEIKFLDGVGTGAFVDSKDRRDTREELLRKYAEAIATRAYWGKVNKETVLLHLAKLRGTDRFG